MATLLRVFLSEQNSDEFWLNVTSLLNKIDKRVSKSDLTEEILRHFPFEDEFYEFKFFFNSGDQISEGQEVHLKEDYNFYESLRNQSIYVKVIRMEQLETFGDIELINQG